MKNKINKYLNVFMELGKVRITFFVAITASAGYILASGRIDSSMLLPVLGIFILSCGSSAFNHYQERYSDKLMDRTKGRPLPAGIITAKTGFLFALTASLTGLAILFLFSSITAFLLGVLALFWYNLLYTPMKRISSLAVVPGALIGSIPPAIGWVAAGGELADPRIWAIALFFFIWQIPHFWLLVLIYDKDYQRGGFPTLTQKFSNRQLTRIAYMWIISLAASCMLLPLFGVSNNIVTDFALLLTGIWLGWKTKTLLNKYYERISFKFAFREINLYVLAVIFILSIDQLIN